MCGKTDRKESWRHLFTCREVYNYPGVGGCRWLVANFECTPTKKA
jgi:hypothetical protein